MRFTKDISSVIKKIRTYNEECESNPLSSLISDYIPPPNKNPNEFDIKSESRKRSIANIESLAKSKIPTGWQEIFLAGYAVIHSFLSECSYLMNDNQDQIHKSVEVAFAHLQRMLVADGDYRQKWTKPKKKGKKKDERDFEKLGGINFLLHKIWAFKIDAVGERTDLILDTVLSENSSLHESVEGLVLTEWKVATPNNVENQIRAAINQANRYASGSLYATELKKYRYIVIVSEKNITIENDKREENGVMYRIINIAYNPDTPSVKTKK